jgi:hypothetical protein
MLLLTHKPRRYGGAMQAMAGAIVRQKHQREMRKLLVRGVRVPVEVSHAAFERTGRPTITTEDQLAAWAEIEREERAAELDRRMAEQGITLQDLLDRRAQLPAPE